MFEIVRYTPDKAVEWNAFVAQSKNGTFLFDRGYMDYHADRFKDFSLMVYKDGNLYALLPANIKGDILTCHGGLTYGPLVMNRKCSAKGIQESFIVINLYLRASHVSRVIYKAIPWIYHQLPAEEDLYAKFPPATFEKAESPMAYRRRWRKKTKVLLNTPPRLF